VTGAELPTGLELHGMRVSLDFAADLGEASYKDANVPAGVPVDGRPDAVPAAPLPAWRELGVEEGRAVLLRRPGSREPGGATVYYKDDRAMDPDDTGDMMSFGDTGVVTARVDDFAAAGFPGTLVVLPPGGAVSAAELAENAACPLVVAVTGRPAPTPIPGNRCAPSGPIYLPFAGQTRR
jgi:hypothetical protein